MIMHNDNQPRPPIQLLVAACAAFGDPDPRCAWLHGFALLTAQPAGASVHLSGTLLTGERYAADRHLVEALEDALDETAVLAGNDLTELVSRLGRLPIDATDQTLALALLRKLEAMIENHCPLDLSLPGGGNLLAAVKAQAHQLEYCQGYDGEGVGTASSFSASTDNINPAFLAAQLADTAGALLLTVGEMYLEPELQQPLLDAWQTWRTDQHARWLAERPEDGRAD